MLRHRLGVARYRRSPELLRRARRLRGEMTGAEERLWWYLGECFPDRRFRRQDVIGPFIVDFSCRSKRLVIEADGAQHALSEDDRSRDRWLQARGWRVLRFWNDEIFLTIDDVLEAIAQALED